MNPRVALGSLLAVIVFLSGCGTEGGGDPVPTPTSLAVVVQPSEGAQSGVAFGRQPVVELRDARGAAVATRGIQVSASIANGTGSLSGTTAVRTDATGKAQFTDLAITGLAGPRVLRFSAAGLAEAVTGTIALEAGGPAALSPAAGNNQTAPAGSVLPIAPGVLVADGAGNPVPNVTVEFEVTAGGGSVEGGTAVSGADGVATVTGWTLGRTVGSNTLTARVGTLEQVFTATATVGAPAKILAQGGDGQSATIGDTVTIAPSFKVVDAFDNPVSGIALTLTPSGGGTTAPVGVQTNASGVAQLTRWTLGLAPGRQTLVASRTGATGATIEATAIDFQVQSVTAGNGWSCALAANGKAFCWGDNTVGQLGDGTLAPHSLPTPVDGSLTFVQISTGGGHTCAITAGGDGYCWGSGFAGQLGDSDFVDKSSPSLVADVHDFTAISAGDFHTCALDTLQRAWCWGDNANGKLGSGFGPDRLAPTAVSGGHKFSAIRAAAAHTCALRTDGQVLCWGSNNGGRLGDGSGIDQPTPVVIAGPAATTFTALGAGGGHSCAVTNLGGMMCWGLGSNGALGNGQAANQPTPVAVSGTLSWAQVAAGTVHTCGITVAGELHCWGSNGSGRLGDGTTTNRAVPTAVLGGFTAASIELGVDHSCARSSLGSALCWGGNAVSQLGNGSVVVATRPIGVHRP